MQNRWTPRFMDKRAILLLGAVALLATGFAVGFHLSGGSHHEDKEVHSDAGPSHQRPASPEEPARKTEVWTCAMHPQIKLPNPGKCPICFMDLIPLRSDTLGTGDTGSRRYAMSEAAKRLARIDTVPVRREAAKVKVRMVGTISEDETRVAALTARVEGRLDEVFVNFTGVKVNKGDPMVTIWSPTLIKSQVELFETLRGSHVDDAVIRGAEEKLIQLGLTREQVQQIKDSKKPTMNITLRAPISGIVMRKMAVLGQFVKEGQEMYIINDLSHVWVKMDAYESYMPWIRYGQDVVFSTSAVPGRQFKGKVLFIDPTLDTRTRSVKIRAEADNPDLSLKPGMFVTAEVEAEVDKAGRVIKREWVGKYICPLHPQDTPGTEPGTCPDSKMPMRPASAYGYADDPSPELPLVIPVSAPLITGKRAVAYVEVPGTGQPTYELREVVIGPRAGDKYVVYGGLEEGEKVVTRGNFKIDSAMQILGKQSVMSLDAPSGAPAGRDQATDEVVAKLPAPAEFLNRLTPVVKAYLGLKEALVEKETEAAAVEARSMANLLADVNGQVLDEKGRELWKTNSQSILSALKTISEQKDIPVMRKGFDPLSESFSRLLMSFRHAMPGPLFVYYCPMASDEQGAYWIEENKEPRNPYFGRELFKGQNMLKCAELTETIPSEMPPKGAK
ncbi:MAG: efflux RND transporter periplasmic adaptor subunit [Pseudomonadota bacterium]